MRESDERIVSFAYLQIHSKRQMTEIIRKDILSQKVFDLNIFYVLIFIARLFRVRMTKEVEMKNLYIRFKSSFFVK